VVCLAQQAAQNILVDRPYFATYVQSRIIKQNKNLIGVLIGETGSGKSWAALSLGGYLAQIFGTSFTIKNVIFQPKDLLEILKNPEKIPSGTVIVWDEAGVGMSAKFWYTLLNKYLSFVLQTFRNQNIILLFTVPNATFIDSDARKLMHFWFEMDGIDYDNKISFVKPFKLQNNLRENTQYKQYLINSGTNQKITRITLPMPEQDILKEYELKKKEWQKELYVSIHQDIMKIDILKRYAPSERDVAIYKLYKSGQTQQQIAKSENLSQMQISRIVTKCQEYTYAT
jgi:ABC-type dipeptide/oligopeptide/nickel transport system ATPase component